MLTPAAGTWPVYLGRATTGADARWLNGRIDEVAIYDTPLAADRIATHYANQRTQWTGAATELQLTASDPDGDPLIFSATGLPPGLTIDAATGLISGSLASTPAGVYPVTATASDGYLSDSQSFTLTVGQAGGAP